MSEGTGVTRQAITRHLDALGRLEKARRYLDRVAAQWDAAAARLKAYVEEER